MTRLPPKEPLIVVVGATGTGKSQLAVSLAKRYNGEVINADAMQLYAGLPIITNKITEEEKQGIPHHLLGCIDVLQPTWIVGTFVKRALSVIEDIRARGKLPILVGGTHYYTQKCLFEDQLADEASEPAGEREHVADTAERWPILKQPTSILLQELERVDPAMADRWHPNDRRKIQTSLEIYLQTGRKASDIYAEQRERKTIGAAEAISPLEGSAMRFSTLLFWVHADTEVLRDRLDRRVDKMIDQGLLDEVQALDAVRAAEASHGSPVDESKGIWISIGYKEFNAYTDALQSKPDDAQHLQRLKDEAIERTKIATRQYAKRQLRWIRLQLIRALADAHASKNLYLLNGTNISRFEQDVVEPALELTNQFLTSAIMPDPASLSATATEMLAPKRDDDPSSKAGRWTKQHCPLCGVTCVTEEQWRMHVKSKSHRKLLRRSKQDETSHGGDEAQVADRPP